MIDYDDFDPEGPYGHDEKYARVSNLDTEELDRALGLESIVIKFEKNDLEMLKLKASKQGILVQVLIRNLVLECM